MPTIGANVDAEDDEALLPVTICDHARAPRSNLTSLVRRHYTIRLRWCPGSGKCSVGESVRVQKSLMSGVREMATMDKIYWEPRA